MASCLLVHKMESTEHETDTIHFIRIGKDLLGADLWILLRKNRNLPPW